MKTEWLRKTIADFDPYFVAPIAEKHVINANENYLNVLTIPGVKEELIQALDTFRPQIYPKPMSDDIREALADYIGAKPENFIVGNGGDEMITYLLGTFLDPGDQICLCRADFLLYREENAALVLAVVLLRIGCIAVACIIRAPGLAVLLIVALPLTVAVSIAVIAGISFSVISTAGVVLVVPVAVAGITLPVIIGMEVIVQ
jgi:hypothetical protein